MPRRHEIHKREFPADPKYGDRMLGRFMNAVMRDGKSAFDVV